MQGPPELGKGKETRGAGRLQGGEKLNKKPNWASSTTNIFPTILFVIHIAGDKIIPLPVYFTPLLGATTNQQPNSTFQV